MPAFCTEYDTFASVRSRSSLLFDTIVAFGARAAKGHLSPSFQRLHTKLRERLCNLVLDPLTSRHGGIEAIQALLIHACYAEDGWLLISLAIRLAIKLNLPDSLEDLLRIVTRRKFHNLQNITEQEQDLFRATRVWCAVFNLEQMWVYCARLRVLTITDHYGKPESRWWKNTQRDFHHHTTKTEDTVRPSKLYNDGFTALCAG